MSEAKDYWDALYGNNMDACNVRNYNVATDFYTALQQSEDMSAIFRSANKMLEVGCGTGEFGRITKLLYPHIDYLGLDIAEPAIRYAKDHYKMFGLRFREANLFSVNEEFDISFISNTIEHFKNPYPLIDRLLTISKYVVVLVPYDQQDLDVYENEGGAGHAITVTEKTFEKYNVVGVLKYFTHTWVQGDNPLQMCVILKA